MECHRCEHSGKFRGVPFADTPCASCRLTDGHLRAGGETDEHVAALGAAYPFKRRGAPRLPVAYPFRPVCGAEGPGEETLASEMPVRVLADAVKDILSLTPDSFRLLQGRFRGETCPEIAARLGIGEFAMRSRLKRIFRQIPELEKLAPVRARFGPAAGSKYVTAKTRLAGAAKAGAGRKPGNC